MLVVYLSEPEENNDVRAQATKEGLRGRTEKGGWVTHPPVGYIKASHLGDMDTSYQKCLKIGFDVAANLKMHYEQSDVEGKHRFMGSVFPYKVACLGEGRYATPQPSRVIGLLTGVEASFESAKAQKLTTSDKLCEMVTSEEYPKTKCKKEQYFSALVHYFEAANC